MKERIYRYSRWDGSQDVDLRWEKLTTELFDRFLETGDFSLAMEWLLRQGFDFDMDGFEMQGLNKMIGELLRLRRDILERFSLSQLGKEVQKRLDQILNLERAAISGRFEEARRNYQADPSEANRKQMEDLFQREGRLANLPPRLKNALESLKNYDWLSPEAEKRFKELTQRIQQIQKFAAQNWFSGNRPMTLEETIEMIDRIRRINRLIEALDNGQLTNINLEDLANFLGPEARQAVETMLNFMEYLQNMGFIHRSEEGWDLTARAIRRIGQRALKDIYAGVHKDAFGSHETRHRGIGMPLPDSPKPYEYGEPMNVDLKATLMAALERNAAEAPLVAPGEDGFQTRGLNPLSPIKIDPRDFQVSRMEYQTSTSTVLLLDMSLSMVREGRFVAAKKVALALEHLIRSQYPRDMFHVVGFSTVARELRGKELAHASGNIGGDIFTNIQDALRLAIKLIARGGSRNKQIILITDGQPTAYTLDGKLHVEWPMFGISPNANRETLKEVKRITSCGATINTFMLDSAPELMRFVNELTRINRGRAFYTTPEKLGQYLLVDYMQRKRKVVH